MGVGFAIHATNRLMERFGIKLTLEEMRAIAAGINAEAAIDGLDGEYDIKIRNRADMQLVAIVKNGNVVTVLHSGKRMGHNKFKKKFLGW